MENIRGSLSKLLGDYHCRSFSCQVTSLSEDGSLILKVPGNEGYMILSKEDAAGLIGLDNPNNNKLHIVLNLEDVDGEVTLEVTANRV